MSPRAFDSFWVQNELDRARENGIPIFPLLLEGRQWLSVQTLQYVDIRDKSLPPEKFYKRLASVTPRKKPISPVVKQEEKTIEPPKRKVIKPVEANETIEKKKLVQSLDFRVVGGILGVLIVIGLCVWIGSSIIKNFPFTAPTSTIPPLPTSPVLSSPTSFPSTETPVPVVPTITSQPTQTPISPTPTSSLGIGSTMISDKDGMTLMYVPAGNFTMGSSDFSDAPVHTVYLDAFWIDRTDITNKMYSLCVNAGVCKAPANSSSSTHSSYYGNSQFDNYPVIYVDWNMANAYCKWAGRQLPTEAQWEKAARGTDGRTYPWGNSIDCSLANYYGNGNSACVGDTTEVGKYPNGASPYGALDMAGEVWQWVNDWYDSNYYSNSPSSDPLGPASGQYRVLRGGTWYRHLVRSANRDGGAPTDTSDGVGFRCSRSQ